jgi:nicotinate-nucleotide adenylyltransferase
MKRIAFYGGSFDPLHTGHLTIAEKLTEVFGLDEFVFVPAFHAPHKKHKMATSPLHRFAMLCLATNDSAKIKVSRIEIESPERPFTIETLTKLKNALVDTEIFFVMGADSWSEITTWREWEKVLTIVNIIVVTRPDYEIGFAHVSEEIRERIVDSRVQSSKFKVQSSKTKETKNKGRRTKDEEQNKSEIQNPKSKIYLTDAVQIDISATEIREKIKGNKTVWREFVPDEVAKYIEKYELYI